MVIRSNVESCCPRRRPTSTQGRDASQPATLIPIGVQRVEELLLSERTCIDTHQLLTGWNDLAGRLQAALFARLASAMSVPSVPMIMRRLAPKSLASGRRTEITWLCQTETRSWMV